MKSPKVAIILVTYNSADVIDDCLNSVLKNNYLNFICVVIDNDSQDRTSYIVQNKYPKITLIQNRKNLGLSAGINAGIHYILKDTQPEYILILNPDTIVDRNIIKKLVDSMGKDKTIGLASPIITYAQEPNKIWYFGGYLNRLFCYTKHPNMNKNIDRLSPSDYRQLTTENFRGFITGACMMIRTSILKQTGLFPEEYFLYFEDVYFSRKVLESDYRLLLFPEALVRHIVSSSTGKPGTNDMSPLQAYYFARNPFIYIKNEVKGSLKITNYLGQFFIRFPYYSFQMLKQKNLASIISYVKGIIDGILYK